MIEPLNDNQKEVLVLDGFVKTRSNQEVVVSTEHFANEGRFILGIHPDNARSSNCKLIVCSLQGSLRCFVVATKSINKLALLYLDYGVEHPRTSAAFCYYFRSLFDIFPACFA